MEKNKAIDVLEYIIYNAKTDYVSGLAREMERAINNKNEVEFDE